MIVVHLHYSIIFFNVLETVVPPVVFAVCCRDTTIQQEGNIYLNLLIFLNQSAAWDAFVKERPILLLYLHVKTSTG